MLRILCICTMAVFLSVSSASAGFKGGPASTQTVREISKAADDTDCILEGRITSQGPKHDLYYFQDATGQILVKISAKRFRGRDITSKNIIRLYGETDYDFMETPKIDVKEFEIIK